MDVGYTIPYCLLFLFWVEEFVAVMWLVLFVVPLLDVFFYVESPRRTCLDEYWPKLCVWMWFPCLFHVVLHTPATIDSLMCASVLYTSTINASRELVLRSSAYERVMASVIYDFTGESIFHGKYWRGSVMFWLWMLYYMRFWWHIGACLIAVGIVRAMDKAEQYEWKPRGSSFGFGNYMFFRLVDDHPDYRLPTSYMWLWLAALVQKCGWWDEEVIATPEKKLV